jgi:membrane fusion protein (multidrug efflux system)
LLVSVSFVVGCGKTIAAPAVPVPEVEVASIVQKDVPIFSEWVATLDGYVNAQIAPEPIVGTRAVVRGTRRRMAAVR